MHLLSQLKLRTKLALLLGLASLAVVASIALGASTLHNRMIEDRIDKLRAVVDTSVGLARALAGDVEAHRLTQAQAVARFREEIHAIRFDAGAGYVAAQAEVPGGGFVILAHGADPSREDKPSNAKDSSGRSIGDMIKEALNGHDSGEISYEFPKPGQTVPLLKLSYVARFAPWQAAFYAGAYTDDLDADFRAKLSYLMTIGGLILLVTLVAAWLINRDITHSLGGLRAAMDRLAGGDLAVEIAGADRRDEVGDMAGAVLVFKQHMTAEARLATEQEALRDQAEVDKRAALRHMAETIEQETDAALDSVGVRTTAMAAIADAMSASALRTGASAQSAAAVAAQALANAQTVASAAEELAASIHEISGRVGQSSEMISRAVSASTETRATIEALNEEVGRIGMVADMISEIAAKTNLLALNATIEAARAGDAGKGFAVVASEVKQLATQTARSTEEIGRHIGQVRSATGASVAAVARIEQTIGEISEISSSIAAAVEQQGAATAEIARNVAETATAANAMTGRTQEVSAEAQGTGRHAETVRENTRAVDQAIRDVKHAVVRVVRTSATEVERRNSRRFQLNLSGWVTASGQAEQPVHVSDLSIGGACLRDAPALPAGGRGVLRLDGAGSMPFVVRSSDAKAIHVSFELDAAGTARLQVLLQRQEQRQAA